MNVMKIIPVVQNQNDFYYQNKSLSNVRNTQIKVCPDFVSPVVLWADVHAMIGMLMLPKTCMYVWAVVMGFLEVKRVTNKE